MNKKASLPNQFNLLYSQVLGIILLFLQPYPLLSEPINKIDYNAWTLWAKPRICVLPSEHLICKMETDIIWTSKKEDNICLLSSKDNAVLHCWSNASGGQIAQTINSDKQITYWLTHEGEDKVLIKTMIRIIRFPQKRIRRRRRHVWSLL